MVTLGDSASMVVAVVLAVSVLVPAAGGLAAGVPDARVAVSDVTVSPATPTAGAPVTVDATVRLSGGSASAVTLDRVQVVTDDGETVGMARQLGALSPGETLTVPVTVEFDTAGRYDLSVVAHATDDSVDRVTARHPLTLVVEPGAPQLEVEAPNAVVGADSVLRTVVSNPTNAALRNLTVTVTEPAAGERVRRTVPTLAAGASQTLNFSVRPTEAGTSPVAVRVNYTTQTGVPAVLTYERQAAVEALSNDVGIRVTRAQPDGGGVADQATTGGLAGLLGGGGGSALQASSDGSDAATRSRVDVTVTNFGNAAIEDVVVVPQTRDGAVAEAVGRTAVADALEPGASTTVTVDLGNVERVRDLEFVAAYDLAGDRHDAATAYDFRPARGAVELTGLNVSVDGDGAVQFSGNLANVGDGEVSGVVVTVADGAYTEPAYPKRNYFVGTVAASEFAPFELTADVDRENATSIPVRVVYTVGDDRVTETRSVPLPDRDSSGRPLPNTGALGGALLVVGLAVPLAVGVLVRYYR